MPLASAVFTLKDDIKAAYKTAKEAAHAAGNGQSLINN